MPKNIKTFGDSGQDREIDALWNAINKGGTGNGESSDTQITRIIESSDVINNTTINTTVDAKLGYVDGSATYPANTMLVDSNDGFEITQLANNMAQLSITPNLYRFNVCAAPYNATGDGTTDDTVAIQACLTAAKAYSASDGQCVVLFPAGKKFLFSDTLDFTVPTNPIHIESLAAKLMYDVVTGGAKPAILWGGSTASAVTGGMIDSLTLHQVDAAGAAYLDWSVASIGLKIQACRHTNVANLYIREFTTGVQLDATLCYVSYMTMNIRALLNHKYGLKMVCPVASSTKFVTEIALSGGSWSTGSMTSAPHNVTEGLTDPLYATYYHIYAVDGGCGSLKMTNCVFEGNESNGTAVGNKLYACYAENVNQFYFTNCRFEAHAAGVTTNKGIHMYFDDCVDIQVDSGSQNDVVCERLDGGGFAKWSYLDFNRAPLKVLIDNTMDLDWYGYTPKIAAVPATDPAFVGIVTAPNLPCQLQVISDTGSASVYTALLLTNTQRDNVGIDGSGVALDVKGLTDNGSSRFIGRTLYSWVDSQNGIQHGRMRMGAAYNNDLYTALTLGVQTTPVTAAKLGFFNSTGSTLPIVEGIVYRHDEGLMDLLSDLNGLNLIDSQYTLKYNVANGILYTTGAGNTLGSTGNFTFDETTSTVILTDGASSLNMKIGASAGGAITSGISNIYQGYTAGAQNQTGNNNINIGRGAARAVPSQNDSVVIGYLAQGTGASTAATQNVIIGSQTGTNALAGNAVVGYNAFFSNTSGSRNAVLGMQAQRGAAGTVDDTVAIGYQAGYSNASGHDNTFVGTKAGYTLTSGAGNVFIGNNAGNGVAADTANTLWIHNASGTMPLICGDFANYKVGIGSSTPAAGVDINLKAAYAAVKMQCNGYDPSTGVFYISGLVASTNVSTGRAFAIGQGVESYSRAVFYSDGSYAVGPGNLARDCYLHRTAASVWTMSSNRSTGACSLNVLGGAGIGTETRRTLGPETANLDVQGSARVGQSTSYVGIGSTGINLYGEATMWDDLRIAATSTKTGGSKDPGFTIFRDNGAGSQGVFSYMFDGSAEEELYFSCQLPHKYKPGSAIYPHFHWSPTTTATGTVIWGLEYTWASIGGTFGVTGISTGAGDIATSSHYLHKLTSLTPISGTSKAESSMLMCRIFRNATASGDTYADDAALLEFDFHFEINKLGTNNELPD